jgi:hypothetical protein
LVAGECDSLERIHTLSKGKDGSNLPEVVLAKNRRRYEFTTEVLPNQLSGDALHCK